jgi:hypothetical protein
VPRGILATFPWTNNKIFAIKINQEVLLAILIVIKFTFVAAEAK